MDSSLSTPELLAPVRALPVAKKADLMLRLIRANQPITRTAIAERLKIDKSTVTERVKPLVNAGIIREDTAIEQGSGRRARLLSFADTGSFFVGVNFGVRRSQVGVTTLGGDIEDEIEFETPADPNDAISTARERIHDIIARRSGQKMEFIGVSVPGMTDMARQKLVYAPNLGWNNVAVARGLWPRKTVPVVVENDSTAAAMYETRMKIRDWEDGLMTNFVLVRSGTGIGVGLVIGSQVYRGAGTARGIAGEFGHMTIAAGGKPCVCGNRGCWEKYASAASAASLYLGDRPPRAGESVPRFVEIVAKAEAGDIRSKRTLEKIGDYLGIGLANVIMGIGIPRVVISGRLVYGWKFIEKPMREAIGRSIVGKFGGWTVEAGQPVGSAIGGALEVAVEEYLRNL